MYTIQQILNLVRVDENGDAIQIVETEQQAFNVIFDDVQNGLRVKVINASGNAAPFPAHYERDVIWAQKGKSVAADRYTLLSPSHMTININNILYTLSSQLALVLSVAATWDTTSGTNYTVAANRAGKDFYVYACQPASGLVPVMVISANSTVPSGYTADSSRKVGGFHCLCAAVGTISGHDLTGFAVGDILPDSIWDLKHRPISEPNGMVWSDAAQIWVDIYLASGTGSSTASVYGGTISDSRNWMDFVDDFGAVKKGLLDDIEFQLIAAGSNEETDIFGSADPVTTGGHSDTASRRMISNIGCEDCCGVMWQWLRDQSYLLDGADFPAAKTWAWYNLPGSKGSLYRQADYGDVKLGAGASWGHGSSSGSRARYAANHRWYTSTRLGGRGRSRKT